MIGEYIKILLNTQIELRELKQIITNNKFSSTNEYLINYSVIKASGSLEVVYKKIFFDCLSAGSTQFTQTYLEKIILDSSSNPSINQITKILSKINNDLSKEFSQNIPDLKKNNLNSLVKLRNSFAHGNRINTSIDTILEYFRSGCHVIIHLYKILHKKTILSP